MCLYFWIWDNFNTIWDKQICDTQCFAQRRKLTNQGPFAKEAEYIVLSFLPVCHTHIVSVCNRMQHFRTSMDCLEAEPNVACVCFRLIHYVKLQVDRYTDTTWDVTNIIWDEYSVPSTEPIWYIAASSPRNSFGVCVYVYVCACVCVRVYVCLRVFFFLTYTMAVKLQVDRHADIYESLTHMTPSMSLHL